MKTSSTYARVTGDTVAEIRVATVDDALSIARVHVDTWRAAYSDLLPRSVLDQLSVTNRCSLWADVVNRGEGELWVAVIDGAVVAFCYLAPGREEPELEEIIALYVRPELWGQGLGFALIRAGLATAEARSTPQVYLWVLDGNHQAIAFYERCGFRADEGQKVVEFGGAEVLERRYRVSLTSA